MAPGTLALRRETEGRKDTGIEPGDESGMEQKAPAARLPAVVWFMRKTAITG
jgi:hypothetical protein